ncbi:MAG: exodeoxyribonuclease VII small subunit [Bacteroidaceae bacterium]|nr:exodeoxyribonuclease VII small subunit [Bacteroidaceae bacterium]
MAKKELTYEEAMQQLEELTRQTESGELPLDKIAVQLKKAQELIAFCREKLTQTEQEIKKQLSKE